MGGGPPSVSPGSLTLPAARPANDWRGGNMAVNSWRGNGQGRSSRVTDGTNATGGAD